MKMYGGGFFVVSEQEGGVSVNRKNMMEQDDFTFFVFESCERCGKDVAPGEHIDLEDGTAAILCRECLEYLSAHEAEFNEFVQRIKEQ